MQISPKEQFVPPQTHLPSPSHVPPFPQVGLLRHLHALMTHSKPAEVGHSQPLLPLLSQSLNAALQT
jgi:hypothetical protein